MIIPGITAASYDRETKKRSLPIDQFREIRRRQVSNQQIGPNAAEVFEWQAIFLCCHSSRIAAIRLRRVEAERAAGRQPFP
jgi:hypothetical protein